VRSTRSDPAQRRFLRLYDAAPRAYDLMDRATFGAWWRLVRRALDFVPEGERALEVGFGPGRLLAALARRSSLAAGVDLAFGMCRYTRRRLVEGGHPPLVACGSAFTLPLPSGYFDAVVSTFALSGFPDPQAALAEMARVAAPGGSVVLIDIGLPPDGNRLGTLLARLWESMGDWLYDYPTLMREAGLRIATCEAFGPGKHIFAVVGKKRSAD
jgi:ubiquinone/menaquinone biosynthesis C-methylase UbiE